MSAKLPLACCDVVPGVGISQNDLHFTASMLASGFGSHNPENPEDVVKAAVNQATFELKVLADQFLEADSNEWYWLLGIIERLEAAAETSEILFKLHQLPHINNPRGASKVQP